jgi:ribosomal protein L34E
MRGSGRQRSGRVVIVVKITPEVQIVAHLGARFCAVVRCPTTSRRVAGIEWRRSLFGRSVRENRSAA